MLVHFDQCTSEPRRPHLLAELVCSFTLPTFAISALRACSNRSDWSMHILSRPGALAWYHNMAMELMAIPRPPFGQPAHLHHIALCCLTGKGTAHKEPESLEGSLGLIRHDACRRGRLLRLSFGGLIQIFSVVVSLSTLLAVLRVSLLEMVVCRNADPGQCVSNTRT